MPLLPTLATVNLRPSLAPILPSKGISLVDCRRRKERWRNMSVLSLTRRNEFWVAFPPMLLDESLLLLPFAVTVDEPLDIPFC